MAAKRVVHWLNKRKRYEYGTNYRTAHYGGAAYWGVDCSAEGWLFLEVTTDRNKVTCENCKRLKAFPEAK